MFKFSRKLSSRLIKDQKGASAVEYAILVGAIALVLGTGATNYATGLSGKLGNILTNIN